MKKKAYGYLRVSGLGQVEGDGPVRQEKSIMDFAKKNGYEIVEIFSDGGVSGTLADRPKLAEMIFSLESAGGEVTVIIERLDRLARDLMIQETIIADLGKLGVPIMSAVEGDISGGDILDDNPTRKLVRQVLGAISEYDKTMTVLKLRAARQRKKEATGKCEGRKSILETSPIILDIIFKMRKKNRKSFKSISEYLNGNGYTTVSGIGFKPANVQMIFKRWA